MILVCLTTGLAAAGSACPVSVTCSGLAGVSPASLERLGVLFMVFSFHLLIYFLMFFLQVSCVCCPLVES